MGPAWADEDRPVCGLCRRDTQRRLGFGHELAGCVRGHCERWDITAVLEPLRLLGAETSQVQVHLRSSPPGRLAVTIQSGLQPVAGGHRQPPGLAGVFLRPDAGGLPLLTGLAIYLGPRGRAGR